MDRSHYQEHPQSYNRKRIRHLAVDPVRLSLETCRKMAIFKQGLHQRPQGNSKKSLLNIIHQIGLLQLDSISVIARSHYMVIFSRVGIYDPTQLDSLLYPDRRLFEQWAHAACLIPIEDYPYFVPVIMERREKPMRYGRLKGLGKDPEGILKSVLTQVGREGPLASKDFKDLSVDRRSWWNRKPARVALDVLSYRGYLMVNHRLGFQPYYDLSERILPFATDKISLTLDDWRRWATLRSLSCLGVATARQISDYYRQRLKTVSSVLESLIKEGVVLTAHVENWEKVAYLRSDDLPIVRDIAAGAYKPMLTTFLSPFDNLIWDRNRIKSLFSFDYSLETYKPASERKYGYYVLPILHQDRLIGRLDAKADRQKENMIIHTLYIEPSESLTDVMLEGIANALYEFTIFHSCRILTIEQTMSAGVREGLLDHLAQCNMSNSNNIQVAF